MTRCNSDALAIYDVDLSGGSPEGVGRTIRFGRVREASYAPSKNNLDACGTAGAIRYH
jgi:hypothetical protein